MTRAGARPGDITIETSDGIAVGDTVRISDEWLGELRRGMSPESHERPFRRAKLPESRNRGGPERADATNHCATAWHSARTRP